MKKVLSILMLVATLFMAGCASETEFGPCVGAFDDRNPNLHYELSIRNVVIGVFFSETIVVPVVVIATETVCPTGKRQAWQHG